MQESENESANQGGNIPPLNDGMSHLVKFTLRNPNHSLFSNTPQPLPSMLVDNEVCSLSGTISELNVEEEGGNN